MDGGQHSSRDYRPAKCIDGSVVSGCLSTVYTAPADKWFSARVVRAAGGASQIVSHIAIYTHAPWGGMHLAPFEVYIGSGPAVRSVRCAGPVTIEPSHAGVPSLLECADACVAAQRAHDWAHVTVVHTGEPRGFFLSELVAYTPATPHPPPPPRPPAHTVLDELNQRWRLGRPSDETRLAGVTVHVFDDYEGWEVARPWEIKASSGFDHLSCTMINAQRPGLYPASSGAGIALTADVKVLCAYPFDSGTGSAPNGACDEHREGGDDVSLHAAMSAQPAYGDSFNEVILGSLDWQEALPRIIAAVVVTRSRGASHADRFRETFAKHFGEELPVFTYSPVEGFAMRT